MLFILVIFCSTADGEEEFEVENVDEQLYEDNDGEESQEEILDTVEQQVNPTAGSAMSVLTSMCNIVLFFYDDDSLFRLLLCFFPYL